MSRSLLVISMFLALTNTSYAKKPIVIAVVDTGFGYNYDSLTEKHLCKYGHKDFTDDQRGIRIKGIVDLVPIDTMNHGTNIVGLIGKFAGKGNYCFVIIKAFSDARGDEHATEYSRKAFRYVNSLKPTIVNYSAGGFKYDSIEYKEVEKYLDQGGTLVAAAGNYGQNLDLPGFTHYPAMYDTRIAVVGNLTKQGTRHATSNYGKTVVGHWEIGTEQTAYGITASGSSQATAIFTGKLVRKLKGN